MDRALMTTSLDTLVQRKADLEAELAAMNDRIPQVLAELTGIEHTRACLTAILAADETPATPAEEPTHVQ